MSEPRDDWIDEPPRRQGVPRWVWITCGSGCLLLVLVIAIAGVAGWKLIEKGRDPEVQWARIEELLPFDERPAELHPELGVLLGAVDQIHVRDRRTGLTGVIHASADRDYTRELMSPSPRGTLFGIGKPLEPEEGELELQGRNVPLLRFGGIKGQGDLGPGVRVDLGDRGESFLVVELHGDAAPSDPKAPPTDDEVRAFFEPFDLWRER